MAGTSEKFSTALLARGLALACAAFLGVQITSFAARAEPDPGSVEELAKVVAIACGSHGPSGPRAQVAEAVGRRIDGRLLAIQGQVKELNRFLEDPATQAKKQYASETATAQSRLDSAIQLYSEMLRGDERATPGQKQEQKLKVRALREKLGRKDSGGRELADFEAKVSSGAYSKDSLVKLSLLTDESEKLGALSHRARNCFLRASGSGKFADLTNRSSNSYGKGDSGVGSGECCTTGTGNLGLDPPDPKPGSRASGDSSGRVPASGSSGSAE